MSRRPARLLRALLDWRTVVFALGVALGVATIATPLDRSGQEGLLTAHLIQHIVLGDLVAPLLLLGLPVGVQRLLREALLAISTSSAPVARAATFVLSPVGALIVWTAVSYTWFVPALHVRAAPGGFVHGLDHVSFLLFGLLIWLGAFDPRPARPVAEALRTGGLPWWARHIYAMVARLSMLPPAIAVWLAAPSAYYATDDRLPFGLTQPQDQERAASVMIGFEMLLFSLAFVLAFIFVSVSEGRERSRQASG